MILPEIPKPSASPKRRWGRLGEVAFWACLAVVLLYRFVLPVPSASLKPEQAAARLPVGGMPTMVEFSATR